MGAIYKTIRLFGLASAFVYSVNSANAFEFSVKSSVPDQDVSQACVKALSAVNAPKMRSYCQTLSMQQKLSEVENAGYEMMSDANALMPLASYFLTHKRTYSSSARSPEAVRAKAEWSSNGLSQREGHWLGAPKGQYIDLSNLSRLSIQAELVRTDFVLEKTIGNDSYVNTQFSFTLGDKPYTYEAWNFGADFHYRYTVKWDSRTLYDGFIVDYSKFGTGRVCPRENKQAYEDCIGYSYLPAVGSNFLKPTLSIKDSVAILLASEQSPLSQMHSFYGSTLLTPKASALFPNGHRNMQTAERPDLASYAGSFQLIEGGRAKFQYRQLPLYTAAQQNAAPIAAGGGITNTAKYLADQQYCAQYAKSTVQEDQSFRSGLGFVAGMAGFGEAASAINTASAITNISEGLSGRELDEANACMRERGHTSIDDAAALDGAAAGATSTYVPYTGGGGSSPQIQRAPAHSPAQGSASAYANPAPTTYQPQRQAQPQPQSEPRSYAGLSGSAQNYSQTPQTNPSENTSENTAADLLNYVPPQMPEGARRSGFCVITLDLTPQGAPINLLTKYCSDEEFEQPSLDAVSQGQYQSEAQAPGKYRKNIETNVRYNLYDDDGVTLIPPRFGSFSLPPSLAASSAPAAASPPQERRPATPATPLSNKIGRIVFVDTDFGFVTAQASGLQIGDKVKTQTPEGVRANFTVAKQSADGNYSLVPDDGVNLNDIQPGYPLAK